MSEPPSPTPPGEAPPPPPQGDVPPPSATGDAGPPPGYVPPPPPPGYGTPPPPNYPPQAQGGPGEWSVGNAFGYGWRKFQQNLGPLIILALAVLLVGIVVYVVRLIVVGAWDLGSDSVRTTENGTLVVEDQGFFGTLLFLSLAFGLVQWIVSQVITAGVAKASLEIVDGRRPELGNLFQGYSIGQVLLASVINGVIVFVGLVLCVIPGLIAAFLLSFTTYFVVDKGMPAMDAIKASYEFTSKRIGQLLLFFLACLAAVVVGACLCGVGLLVAIPVVIIAQAFTFRMLRGEPVAP